MSLNIKEYIEKINLELVKEGEGFRVEQITLENTNPTQSELIALCKKWALVYNHKTDTWERKCIG